MTAAALKTVILKDKLFYDTSGGGVVFSGGEVLANVNDEFISLLSELKEDGVSIGLDTCGYAPKDILARVLPYTDYFLWDLKQMDKEKHRTFTGVDNRLILDRLDLRPCGKQPEGGNLRGYGLSGDTVGRTASAAGAR